MPAVIRSLRSGSASITSRGKRGALAHRTDNLEALKGCDYPFGRAKMRVEDLDVDVGRDAGPVGER